MNRTRAKIVALVILVAAVAIGGYFILWQRTSAPAVTRTQAEQPGWKSYVNQQYGFTFRYPVRWTLTQSADDKNITLDAGILTSVMGENGPIPALTVNFKVVDNSAFGTAETKYGEIQYDPTRKALVDISETPPRCLPSQSNLGITTSTPIAMPVITFGGSLMSDPVWTESAILTNKDYMIVITSYGERTGDQRDIEIEKLESQLDSSFEFIDGATAVAQKC